MPKPWPRLLRAIALVLASVLACAGGERLASAWLPTPPPELHELDFTMRRDSADAYEVRPGHPLAVPFAFGDFRLFAEIELAEDTDLDLVVRHVEPLLREDGMPLFHARYGIVRASTRAAGEPVLSRSDALFDRPDSGGVELGAGRLATVQLEGSGRVVTGTIAGVRIQPFATTDAHGAFAIVASRGSGVVRTFVVTRVPRPNVLLPIGWCALAGGILGVCLATLRGSARRALAALLVVPASAWVGGAVVIHHLLPETEPDTVSVVLIGLSGAPAALALARLRSPLLAVAVGLVAGVVALEFAVRREAPRLAPFEDPRLTAALGFGSGSTAFDVLVPRLRAQAAVHVPHPAPNRAFFLGGGPLYESGVERERWVGPLAAGAAAQRLGAPVDGVVVPTVYSHAYQQLVLFERYCVDAFRPRAVVFTVPPWEGEALEPADARSVLEGDAPGDESGFSALLALWRASRVTLVPTTDAQGLVRTLEEFDDLARARGIEVLFAVPPGLDPALAEAVAEVARERGRELRAIDFEGDPVAAIATLSEWLLSVLGE